MNETRRTFLRNGAAVGAIGAIGLSGPAVGQGACDVLVDASGGGDATTIQEGVSMASPGDTVCVADGTYTEHVHVDKDLTLTNAVGASPAIEMPADPPDYVIPESGNTWEVVVFGGPASGDSTVEFDLSGIEIDGLDRQPNARVGAGILLRNVVGRVEEMSVVDMGVGGRQTGGIAIYGDSEVAVHRNVIDTYERFGIVANGDGGAHPAPTLDAKRNAVTGSGDGSQTSWAPNGIQIGFGAGGTVQHNSVDRNRWSDEEQVASGIIIFESDGVTVSRNTVTESDAALTCGTWAWFRQSASDIVFVQNDVDGAVVGVHLESIAWDGFSMADPTLDNTKVVNNELTQGGTGSVSESIGVELLSVDDDPDFDPSLDNTKIIRNTIDGFATEIADDGTETRQHANVLEP